MDVYEAIDQRRSIRIFTQAVSHDVLRKLILAGTKAPSGSNVQPWEFIIIDDPIVIKQLAEYKYQQTLKMTLDEMVLEDPCLIEHIYQQTLDPPPSLQRAERQRATYRNCAVVAVCHQKGHGIGRKPWMNVENIASTWMCIENIALAATADGLGLVTSFFREEHKVAVEKLLDLPEDQELATILLIGIPEDRPREPRSRRRPPFSWLHHNRFGSTLPVDE
jgi:nitroreductase